MEPTNSSGHPKHLSVLMVDDDISYAKIVQHQLQKFPTREFRLTWKESVEDALKELRGGTLFDVILTDYNFPTSNGLAFCLELNRMSNHTPIIFLTGTRDFKLAVEAMKLGVEDFLVKEDMVETHLPRTLINVIERTHMRGQLQAVEKRMTIAENRSQAIRELVVTVCHEFNNPLAAIKISADLVGRSLETDAARLHLRSFDLHFQKIEEEIKRLRDINFERISFNTADTTTPPSSR